MGASGFRKPEGPKVLWTFYGSLGGKYATGVEQRRRVMMRNGKKKLK
jgi:hypothetical protein